MRSHHAPRSPEPELPGPSPWPDTAPVSMNLLLRASFAVTTCMRDYASCRLCRRGIGFDETVAATEPPEPFIAPICWNCLVGILDLRTDAILDGHPLPARIGTGLLHLEPGTLNPTHPLRRRS